jgi:hypothetical protein
MMFIIYYCCLEVVVAVFLFIASCCACFLLRLFIAMIPCCYNCLLMLVAFDGKRYHSM